MVRKYILQMQLNLSLLEPLVNKLDGSEQAKFTKEELDVPKEQRRYTRKSSLKWKVRVLLSYYQY